MKIKQLFELDDILNKEFYNFCFKSKPYDFCSINSKFLRDMKIQEYLNVLYDKCEIYTIEYEQKRAVTCFFIKYDNFINLEFIFGNFNEFNSTRLINSTHLLLKHILEKHKKNKVTSTVQRKHKKNQYLKWIKKYDKKCEIFENFDNIEDTQIIWTYERLS